MYQFGTRSKNNLNGVHPKLVNLLETSLRNSPCDFTITDGVRTLQQQAALYAQGRTTPGNIVTNCDGIRSKSNHQVKADGYGHAVDLYPYHNGSVQLNDIPKLRQIADHIKATAKSLGVNIRWGGDFTSLKDYPHFELI